QMRIEPGLVQEQVELGVVGAFRGGLLGLANGDDIEILEEVSLQQPRHRADRSAGVRERHGQILRSARRASAERPAARSDKDRVGDAGTAAGAARAGVCGAGASTRTWMAPIEISTISSGAATGAARAADRVNSAGSLRKTLAGSAASRVNSASSLR